jgi:hypothetical protein
MEHKQTRLTYVMEMHAMEQQGAAVGYLDEAWNYLWSLRKKMKHLPRENFEEEGADRIQVRRVISRSHPIKVMFMGVVFKPQPERTFDGKIALKRVSRTRQLERDTYRSNKFHHDNNINQLIVDGDWRNVYDDKTYTMLELTTLIAAHYELDDDIAEALCL